MKSKYYRFAAATSVMLAFLLTFNPASPPILHGATLLVPQDHPSIQSAIDLAGPGDIVQVSAGFFEESIIIDKGGLTLQGAGSAASFIHGTDTQPAILCDFSGDQNTVVIRGFNISSGKYGIKLAGTASATIEDNVIAHNSSSVLGYGIYMGTNTSAAIRRNRIAHCGQCIHGQSDNLVEIVSNEFYSCRGSYGGAINLTGGTAVVKYNDFDFCRDGVLNVYQGNWTQFTGNTIIDCDGNDRAAGLNVSNSMVNATNNMLKGGLIFNSDETGCGLNAENSDVTLVNNTFFDLSGLSMMGEGVAARVVDSDLLVKNNIFYQNKNGQSLIHAAGSGNHEITYNLFFDNTTGEITNGLDLASNNILDQEPLFIDKEAFYLVSASPGVNAGDPGPEYNDLDWTRNNLGLHGGPGGDLNASDVMAKNHSVETQCAEEDNVHISFTDQGKAPGFTINAYQPAYEVDDFTCTPNFDMCNFDNTGLYPFPDPFSGDKIHDKRGLYLLATRQPLWWRPSGMEVVVDNVSVHQDVHMIEIGQKIYAEKKFPVYLVIYSDGNLRLIPFPPEDSDSVCFGSSTLVGSYDAQSPERPAADIESIHFFSKARKIILNYRSGNQFTLKLSEVNREQAQIRVDVTKQIETDSPFLALNSMFVDIDTCDVSHISWLKSQSSQELLVSDFDQAIGSEWFFFRPSDASTHNLSGPDIKIKFYGSVQEEIKLVINTLSALQPEEKKQTVLLGKALNQLGISLNPTFWETTYSLEEKRGSKVFQSIKSSLNHLLKLKKSLENDPEQQKVITEAIDSIADSSRVLASISIDLTSPLYCRATFFKKAEDNLDRADAAFAEGKVPKAIQFWRNAWTYMAKKAMKKNCR